MEPMAASVPEHEPFSHYCETADGKPFKVYEDGSSKGAWIELGGPGHSLGVVSQASRDGTVRNYVCLNEPSVSGACRVALSAEADGGATVQVSARLEDGSLDVRSFGLDELVRLSRQARPLPA